MHRFVSAITFTAVVGLAASACSSKNNNTPTPVDNNTVVMTSTMNAQNEVPPITNADQTGTGTATITFHLTRDAANNVTAATTDFVVNLANFPANTPITNAHIHLGATGVGSGNVVVGTGITAGELTLNASGAGSFTKLAAATDAATAQGILANPAGYYFNVHTQLTPGGAIRGQLVKQ